jgi:uncharacterized protein YsxB (DUF464 family)
VSYWLDTAFAQMQSDGAVQMYILKGWFNRGPAIQDIICTALCFRAEAMCTVLEIYP